MDAEVETALFLTIVVLLRSRLDSAVAVVFKFQHSMDEWLSPWRLTLFQGDTNQFGLQRRGVARVSHSGVRSHRSVA